MENCKNCFFEHKNKCTYQSGLFAHHTDGTVCGAYRYKGIAAKHLSDLPVFIYDGNPCEGVIGETDIFVEGSNTEEVKRKLYMQALVRGLLPPQDDAKGGMAERFKAPALKLLT